jgi:hypothetical protein
MVEPGRGWVDQFVGRRGLVNGDGDGDCSKGVDRYFEQV